MKIIQKNHNTDQNQNGLKMGKSSLMAFKLATDQNWTLSLE